MMQRTVILSLLLLVGLLGYGQDRISGRSFATRSVVMARHGMACTSQPLATMAAIDILKRGGTAVDAAIAANAVLGVVEPTGSGVGGDLFALVWDGKTRQLYGLNGSGRSPYTLSYDYFKQKGLTHIPALGPLPVSVPGCVDAWYELHSKFGRLPMADVLAPAIRYAEEGFALTEVIGYYWGRSVAALNAFEGFKENFTVDGRAPAVGEVFKRPNLARTLAKIAQGGRDAFYKGEIARQIEAYFAKQGGFLTARDLADHHSEWVQPLSVNYRGYQVWQLPPNSQGLATLQLLNLLEGFDLGQMGYGSAPYVHTFVEAKKLVFEDRARYYADPDFTKIPIQQLISKEYAAERRKLITDRAAKTVEAGNPALRQGDTIYLTVADEEGTMVSLIQSNYRGMGSGMCVPELGFIFQDRGELFDVSAQGRPNSYAPHKRPFQTIIPGFVTKDGQPYLSFGVMGGEFQPLGQVQTLINILDFGMNLQEAGDAPRMAHTGSSEPTGEGLAPTGGEVQLESGFPPETVRELLKRGHRITWDLNAYGGYQAIRWDPVQRVYHGASESRKDGMAAGW